MWRCCITWQSHHMCGRSSLLDLSTLASPAWWHTQSLASLPSNSAKWGRGGGGTWWASLHRLRTDNQADSTLVVLVFWSVSSTPLPLLRTEGGAAASWALPNAWWTGPAWKTSSLWLRHILLQNIKDAWCTENDVSGAASLGSETPTNLDFWS